jgi:RNA polymerase sigma-70 factor (ECF subfamily)
MAGETDFENVVKNHHASLYRFALSLTRNESDAADLVQETFLRWAKKGHQLEDASKVKSWLFTTLHREFLGRRRRVIRFAHHELESVSDELPEVAPDFAGRVDWETVAACLERLDESFQAPVSLFYMEDCAYNEIAGILDLPLGTVKSRISRGIGQLQRMLLDRGVAGGTRTGGTLH